MTTVRDECSLHTAFNLLFYNLSFLFVTLPALQFLVLDSLLRWAGVVDELDFAKRLVSWKRSGVPELGDTEGFLLSDLTKLVLQEEGYVNSPHQVALQVFQRSQPASNNGIGKPHDSGDPVLVDNGSLTRAIALGIPVFHNLSEVASNSVRICLATHPEEQCKAASVAISTTLATILQVRYLVLLCCNFLQH